MDGGRRESERERLKMVLSCLHLKSSSRPSLCGKVFPPIQQKSGIRSNAVMCPVSNT